MDLRRRRPKVHEAASEIAMTLGTELMKMLPGLTAKYAINSQSFIVAAVQAAVKVGASGVSSVTRMKRDELVALQRDLKGTCAVSKAISGKLPALHVEHDQIWQVASDEGRNAALLVDLSETFDRIEETLEDYGQTND